MTSLTFLGAAGTVTGSKYLLEHQGKKIMVDCGLFQGLKELRLLNWAQPSFDPASVEAILLTHGHMDHTGYLPRLVKLGFKGVIYGTELTLKIAEIILRDAAKIQEEEAERANLEGYSKHKPALPLYTLKDVEATLKLFQPVKEGVQITVLGLFKAQFLYNGHILGSTFIELVVGDQTFVFSGDVGREKDLLLYPPKKPSHADVLLMESTYGGKTHPDEFNLMPELAEIVNQTVNRGGILLIPSFAVERTQLLMVMLWKLMKEEKIPEVPMIMDSPMGTNILDLFRRSKDWHKLSEEECEDVCSYFRIVTSYKETMQIREQTNPKIVIAGSGMMTGGRILSYMEVHGPHEKDTLLFVGFQAEGTRGWRILNGEKSLKMFGKWVPIRLQVRKIEGLSAHADQNELLSWIAELDHQPKNMFLIHGEKDQLQALKDKLKEAKDWEAHIPKLEDRVEL